MASFLDAMEVSDGEPKMCLKEEGSQMEYWPPGDIPGSSGTEVMKEVKPDCDTVLPEPKRENLNHIETDSNKDDADDGSDSDFNIKEELGEKGEEEASDSEESVSLEEDANKSESDDEDQKPEIKPKPSGQKRKANFQRIVVQNYKSKTYKEDPVDNFKHIFKESPLEFEKQKFHQQIFEEIVKSAGQINLNDLQSHYLSKLRQAAKIEVFTCSLCKYQTMNMTNLKCHLLILHKGKMEREIFKCDTCNYESNSETYMSKHLLVHNTRTTTTKGKCKKKEKEQKFPCNQPDCTFEGRSEEGLERHMKTHRRVVITQCDLCSFTSEDTTVLKNHKDTHKVGHKFHCYMCEYKNNCKTTLALHLLNVHKIANEASKRAKICEICSSAFSNTPLLLRHYISHKTIQELSENEIHKCPECNYQAKYKTSLNAHMVVHKAPEFICEFCGFATKHRKNYKDHLITHKKLDEIEWFRCAICPYQARNKKLLAKHIKKGDHSGKRLLHVRNRDRLREAEERGEDINLVIKKYRIRKINGVKVKTERIKKPSKNPKKQRKPRKKSDDKPESELLQEEMDVLSGTTSHQLNNSTNVQLFGFLPPLM